MNFQKRPLVIAHRGASTEFPENSLDAFSGAFDQGADWIELDVRRSKDGVLVVHHDAHLVDGSLIRDLDSDCLPGGVPSLAALSGMKTTKGNVKTDRFKKKSKKDEE